MQDGIVCGPDVFFFKKKAKVADRHGDNHPLKDLAKFGYIPDMKYKSIF
jgi:hypothetical protein